MKMKRLNITLPDDLEKELEALPNKSRFIALALREKLEREKRQKLDSLLIEGYQATKEEDKALNEDWQEATLKDWQQGH
jgi:metal-responsive CopG/Arc/MetJ family transcriptional regulator